MEGPMIERICCEVDKAIEVQTQALEVATEAEKEELTKSLDRYKAAKQ